MHRPVPPPRSLRLRGAGRVVLPGTPTWDALSPADPALGARQIILAEIDRVQTSCGFGVPRFAYEGQRGTLDGWAETQGPDGLMSYRLEKTRRSIDGLPAPLADPAATA